MVGAVVSKSFIPFEWNGVIQALDLTPGEHLTLLYLMAGTRGYNAEGKLVARGEDGAAFWHVLWDVKGLERLAHCNRSASTSLKKKLASAQLAMMYSPYDRERRIAEVWDVSKLVGITKETALSSAATAKDNLGEAPVPRRVRKPKAATEVDSAPAEKPVSTRSAPAQHPPAPAPAAKLTPEEIKARVETERRRLLDNGAPRKFIEGSLAALEERLAS